MRSLSATETARRFSDVLDVVENLGETIVIVRRGRAVAQIGPAPRLDGRAVKDLLRRSPSDSAWVDDVRQVRAAAQVEDRPWPG